MGFVTSHFLQNPYFSKWFEVWISCKSGSLNANPRPTYGSKSEKLSSSKENLTILTFHAKTALNSGSPIVRSNLIPISSFLT